MTQKSKIALTIIGTAGIGLFASIFFLVSEGKNAPLYFLGYISLILINLGIAILIHSRDEQIRKKRFNIALLIGATMALCSIIFSLLHITGANVFIVETVIYFIFAITPVFTVKRYQKWKKETCNTFISLILSISDFLSAFFILEGYMFKLMHWPTASAQIVIGIVFLLLAVFGWNHVYKSAIEKRKIAEEKLSEAYSELELKHRIIEEKQKEIVDSINYAKRIQGSVMPNNSYIEKHLKR